MILNIYYKYFELVFKKKLLKKVVVIVFMVFIVVVIIFEVIFLVVILMLFFLLEFKVVILSSVKVVLVDKLKLEKDIVLLIWFVVDEVVVKVKEFCLKSFREKVYGKEGVVEIER